jgi:ubiquitin-like modifier-activating enzyme ATG7
MMGGIGPADIDSRQVVDVYRKEGIDMLLKAFEDAKYLEQITGLDALHAETEAVLEAVDWDEDDDEM